MTVKEDRDPFIRATVTRKVPYSISIQPSSTSFFIDILWLLCLFVFFIFCSVPQSRLSAFFFLIEHNKKVFFYRCHYYTWSFLNQIGYPTQVNYHFFTKASFHSYRIDKTQGAKGQKPCIYSLDVHPDGTRLATGGLGTVRMT